MPFHVYIVHCADDTLYTGIAKEVVRRVAEHNGMSRGKDKGARYTRARRPVSLVYEASFLSRAHACKEEARIKGLSRAQKLDLIAAAQAGT